MNIDLSLDWAAMAVSLFNTIVLCWLGLTVLFEFVFGHYIMGNPWSWLLHDYDLSKGRVWILVLIWVTGAPYVFYRLGQISRGDEPVSKDTNFDH